MRRQLTLLVCLISVKVTASELAPLYPATTQKNDYILQRNQRQADKAVFHQQSLRLKEIIKSPTKMSYLKKNTLVLNIETNEVERYPQEGYVRIYTKADDWGYIYLDNGKKFLQYKVKGEDLVSITNELAMFDPPQQFQETIKKVVRDTDPLAHYTHFVYFNDKTTANSTGAMAGNPNMSGSGNRLEMGHLVGNNEAPAYFGGVIQIEKQTFEQGASASSWSLGPAMRTKEFTLAQVNLNIGAQVTLGSTSVSAPSQQFSNFNGQFVAAQLSIEHQVKTKLGTYLLGAAIRRQWINYSFTKNQSTSNLYDQTLSLMFGIVFGDGNND